MEEGPWDQHPQDEQGLLAKRKQGALKMFKALLGL